MPSNVFLDEIHQKLLHSIHEANVSVAIIFAPFDRNKRMSPKQKIL